MIDIFLAKNVFFFFFKVFTSAVNNLKIVIFNVYVPFLFFQTCFLFGENSKTDIECV